MIKLYTDGACSGNPGPAGAGFYIEYPNKSEYSGKKNIGHSTNNIAELTAIKMGLEKLLDGKNSFEHEVVLSTDSQYCIKSLTGNWKIKKNIVLIMTIKSLIEKFKNLTFEKVKGHSGNKGNEIADQLATSAIK